MIYGEYTQKPSNGSVMGLEMIYGEYTQKPSNGSAMGTVASQKFCHRGVPRWSNQAQHNPLQQTLKYGFLKLVQDDDRLRYIFQTARRVLQQLSYNHYLEVIKCARESISLT